MRWHQCSTSVTGCLKVGMDALLACQTALYTHRELTKLTPVLHLAYITPFHSPSIEVKDFLSFGELKQQNKLIGIFIQVMKNGNKICNINLQDFCSYSVFFASIEWLGMKYNAGIVSCFCAGYAAFASQFHPWNCQN